MPITRAGSLDLGGLNVAAPPLTTSFTNSGNILFVYADCSEAPTSITFNGISLTPLFISATPIGSYLYYLTSPSVATANIVINFAGGSISMEANAVSYAGVDLSSFDTPLSETVDPTSEVSYSSTVATASNNCWGVGWAHSVADQVVSIGGSFTLVVLSALFNNGAIADTNGPVHPAGSLTFTSSGTTANTAEHLFASLRPALTAVFSDAGARFDEALAVRSGNERRITIW